MKNVLVLGIKGMLGSMVYHYLRANSSFVVAGTYRGVKQGFFFEKDADLFELEINDEVDLQLRKIFDTAHFDYIVNAIGVIKPYCKDNDMVGVQNAVMVNALFPHRLAKEAADVNPEIKIIQIATDCVFSGKQGRYDESAKHDPLDVYGKTKSLGEVQSRNFLNIRCSIVGPELKGKLSLLEWFLSNTEGAVIQGFAHHKWNGVTTLQFAQLCADIIENNRFEELRKINYLLHYVINETVDKFQLLNVLNEVYKRNYQIKRVSDVGEPIDRTLTSKMIPTETNSLKDAFNELYAYSQNSGIY